MTDTRNTVSSHPGSPTSFTRTTGEPSTAEMPVLIPRPQRSMPRTAGRPPIDLTVATRVLVGDIPFTVTSFEDAVTWLLVPTSSTRARGVRLANAYCVAMARNDPGYAHLMSTSGVNFPDGTPVHWVMQRATRRSTFAPERVRGPSLFVSALGQDDQHTARHFFLGGTPETMALMQDEIARRFPRAQVAGAYAPPFGPVTPEVVAGWAERIAASGATVVWVGLGSPKQDYATTLLAERVRLHCVGVGAAFDFLAGTQREAPAWTQRLAMEWAYRLVTEPQRLWRRYLLGNLRFLQVVARQRTGRRQIRTPLD